jgi:hypothetical protein
MADILRRINRRACLLVQLWLAGVGATSRSIGVGSEIKGLLNGLFTENALFDVSKQTIDQGRVTLLETTADARKGVWVKSTEHKERDQLNY